ncbi:hypothetical protein MASR2M54_26150 [Aliarcobacter cryaerophilus]
MLETGSIVSYKSFITIEVIFSKSLFVHACCILSVVLFALERIVFVFFTISFSLSKFVAKYSFQFLSIIVLASFILETHFSKDILSFLILLLYQQY